MWGWVFGGGGGLLRVGEVHKWGGDRCGDKCRGIGVKFLVRFKV